MNLEITPSSIDMEIDKLSSSHSSLNSTQLSSAKTSSEMSEEIVPIFGNAPPTHHTTFLAQKE